MRAQPRSLAENRPRGFGSGRPAGTRALEGNRVRVPVAIGGVLWLLPPSCHPRPRSRRLRPPARCGHRADWPLLPGHDRPARHEARGTRHPHPAPGTQHPAPGTRHPALGTRHPAPGTGPAGPGRQPRATARRFPGRPSPAAPRHRFCRSSIRRDPGALTAPLAQSPRHGHSKRQHRPAATPGRRPAPPLGPRIARTGRGGSTANGSPDARPTPPPGRPAPDWPTRTGETTRGGNPTHRRHNGPLPAAGRPAWPPKGDRDRPAHDPHQGPIPARVRQIVSRLQRRLPQPLRSH